MSISVAEYKAIQGKQRTNKYGNKRVVVDGWGFDSKLEAARYEELKLFRKSGDVAWFICQPAFRLPGGITYRADFLVVWRDDEEFGRARQVFVTVEDVKGHMTRVSLNKIKQVEAIYGIKIRLIKRRGEWR